MSIYQLWHSIIEMRINTNYIFHIRITFILHYISDIRSGDVLKCSDDTLSCQPAKFDHVMYADDTTLISTLENFGPTNNAKELEQNINDEISKVAT